LNIEFVLAIFEFSLLAMNLIFWQGIISIHQKSFLEALAWEPRVKSVTLVVEQTITDYRKNMGWDVPEIKHVQLIIAPDKQHITEIFATNKNAIHILGGLCVSPMMTNAINAGIAAKAKMGIMTEPYDRAGIKGMLRDIKYRYLKIRYSKHIDFLLTIGKEGVNAFTRLGFNTEKVFPWAYFVTIPLPERVPDIAGKIRILYAGRVTEQKGIYRFVKELAATGNKDYVLDIYGDGPDVDKIRALMNGNSGEEQIHLYPFQKYDDMLLKYCAYDWVVLPSTQKDGWGVIINEGLLNGLKGICSNICGVSWAIKDGKNGVTFDWHTEHSCGNAIKQMLANESFWPAEKTALWAGAALTGEAGAAYCLQILDNVYDSGSRPTAPWLTEQ